LNKAKPKDIKQLREQYWAENNQICPVCQHLIELKDAVLDHRHSDGLIRNTIHRFCNTFISHIENNQKRNRITPQQLTNILANFEQYVDSTKSILHPTYRTPEERLARAKKRAKARRSRK